MMKKILRMLLLGFLTVTVLSPSVVTAEEDQTGQVPSSSVYSEIDGIAPLATPGIEEVVLDNNESYEFTRMALFPPGETYRPPFLLFKIKTISGEKEAFSVQLIDRAPNSESRPTYTTFIADSVFEEYSGILYYPENSEIHELGYRITNYSAGPVAYRFGINIGHGTYDNLPFELP